MKTSSKFNTNFTAITSSVILNNTHLFTEKACPSYSTGKEDRMSYGVFLLFASQFPFDFTYTGFSASV